MAAILDILDTLRPRLPKSWVPHAALQRVRASAAPLPDGSPVCFVECRFAKQSRRVDFGLCYPYPSHRALLNGNRFLADRIPFLWVEVDCDRIPDHSSPSVLLCLDRKLGRHSFGRVVPDLTEKRLLNLASAAYGLFLRETPARPVQASLQKCFAALPTGGRFLHLSLMPSRDPPVAKLNISLPKRSLAGYLRRVGWTGSFSSMETVWRGISPALRTAKIDLTLTPSLRPKIGFEIHPFNTSIEGRYRVLDWLRNQGLADTRQCVDLAAWHGAKWAFSAGNPTPVELDFGMKVVLDEESTLEAKAYFQLASSSLIAKPRAAPIRRKSHD